MDSVISFIKLFFTTKTGRVALGAIIAAAGMFLQDKLSVTELIVAIVAAIQTVNLRHGIAKIIK